MEMAIPGLSAEAIMVALATGLEGLLMSVTPA